MSVFLEYYDCANAGEVHVKQAGRMAIVLNDAVPGVNARIFQIPEENIESVDCADSVHFNQLLRQCLFIDDGGRVSVRLIQGV